MTPPRKLLPSLPAELHRLVVDCCASWYHRRGVRPAGIIFDVQYSDVLAILDACRTNAGAFEAVDAARLDLVRRFEVDPDERVELAGEIGWLFECERVVETEEAKALDEVDPGSRAGMLVVSQQLKNLIRRRVDEDWLEFLRQVVDALDEARGGPVASRWVVAMVTVALVDPAAWAEFRNAVNR